MEDCPVRGYVTSVDRNWYDTIHSLPRIDEVNVWRPGTRHHFRALQPGEPVFLRLKAPADRIIGAGLFTHASILPVSAAWKIFREANGERSLLLMKEKLSRLRFSLRMDADGKRDPRLGCILLQRTIIFEEKHWLEPPADLDDRAGHGKTYDLSGGEGRRLWLQCLDRFGVEEGSVSGDGVVSSRLGPKSFKVAVLDAWGRRCAVTGEGVIAALDAVEIRPATPGSHSLSNGLLLRSDLAALFEAGYVTVSPQHVLMVSQGRPSDETGRDYERLHGTGLRLPTDPTVRPDPELLWWHQSEMYLG